MAAPTSLQTYPADSDTGIPVGIDIEIVFDRGIDLYTAQNHVVLYGDDFDETSGPDSAIWADGDTGQNPYFLRSPGFKGLVELEASLVYVDLDTGPTYTEVDPGVITGEADETGYAPAGVGHKLVLTPREPLAPDTEYTLHVLGDPDSIDTGVSSRTVFDVRPEFTNIGVNAVVHTNFTYTGTTADTVVVEITTGGNIGTAEYRWYYDSLGVGTAVTGLVTSRRFRRLQDGLQLRFSGSGFFAGDIYKFNVEPIERMASSFTVTFTTNDGSYSTAPSSPSTPATSSPPSSVLPPAPGASTTTSALEILEMTPYDGAYNVSTDLRTITIVFSDTLDASTITDDSVELFKYPVSGLYQGQSDVVELEKILTVSGDTLTIEF